MRHGIAVTALLVVLAACGGGPPRTTSASGPPTVVIPVVVSPIGAYLAQGATQLFSVTSGVGVNWSVQEGAAGGSITGLGVYTAPNAAGTFHVIATSKTDSTNVATATVTVTPVSILTNSNSVSMAVNETAAMTNFVFVTGTTNTNIVWSIVEGAAGGSITSAGIYTAPATLGTYHVLATSQADSKATVTLPINVSPVSVTVFPKSDVLGPSGVRPFGVTVSAIDQRVTWSVLEAASGGTITGLGVYTAPSTPGLFHVTATSQRDTTASATAPITVVASGFQSTGNMVAQRSAPTATLLPSGKVLVAGGDGCLLFSYYYGSCPLQSAELYDPSTGAFSSTGSMSTARVSHTATMLPNNKVLVTGGGNASSELYDPATGVFSSTGSMSVGRTYHTATVLQNGKVLVTGGDAPLGGAELYDPQTGTFSATGKMTVARASHTATLLPSGKVLIAGGNGFNSGSQATAEVYDPATGTFTATGNMTTGRSFHTATLLGNGKVLIAGGVDLSGTGLSTAELYDPAAGTFTATGTMIAARDSHISAVLPNGQVLVSGGNVLGTQAQFIAEIFDPATGGFTQTGSMKTGRILPAAATLNDGRILVVGGSDLSSAEIYK